MKQVGRMGWLLMWVLLITVTTSTAQIRIIPRSTLDSIANPATISNPPLLFDDGGKVDFGSLDEDSGAWHGKIGWRYVGREPLVITRITSSCGCLRAEFDRHPLREGARGTIRLTYNPKGHPGTVYQRLFLYTNLSTTRPTAIIQVRGVVTPSRSLSAGYPYAMGALRLRVKEVQFEPNARELRIACRNVGDKRLCVAADTLLSSRGWQLSSDPACLEGGAEGDLVIRPIEAKPKAGDVIRLYVRGLILPPRERVVTIRVMEKN